MKELVERLKNKPFRIVGINSDTDRDKTKQLLRGNNISWRNVVDGGTNGPISRAWHVQSWPTYYLIDATGKIRYAGDELRSVVPIEDNSGGIRIVNVMDEDIGRLLAEMPK